MIHLILRALVSSLRSRRDLAAENLALRHQLNFLQRNAKRPQLRRADGLLWVLLFRFWKGWRESLTMVRPETVIRWHREGF